MRNRLIVIRTADYLRVHARLTARGLRVLCNRHINATRQEWVVAVPRR